jgi:hypothetical protein
MSTDIQTLTDLGERLGLEGTELQSFISKQQELARDERASERETQKEIEIQRTEQLRLQLQLKQHNDGLPEHHQNYNNGSEHSRRSSLSETRDDSSSQHRKVKGPKLTPYDERDDIDSYIVRFEKYAKAEKWEKESWAIYLSALLRGRALDVYARLPVAEANNFDKLNYCFF